MEERSAIAEALAVVYASIEEAPFDSSLQTMNTIGPYDAVIVDLASIAEASIRDDVALARLDQRPVIAIADETALGDIGLLSTHLQWEVIVRPLHRSELMMRLARVIAKNARKA